MKDTETSHFWVGCFPKAVGLSYFSEVWDEEDPDRDHTPLSAFARDQGENWYDHDFMELGWREVETIQQLVKGHSYNDQWGEELARRVEAAGLTGFNLIVFISEDQIEHPRSIHCAMYWLHYLGTITYRI